jgi:hypothetical protein
MRQVEGMSENWVTMGLQFVEKTGGKDEEEVFLAECVRRDAHAIPPRLHLARLLLRTQREQEAEAHLGILNQKGVAEAAFYLGVSAIRRCEWRVALRWMKRAEELNPQHSETKQQIERLTRILADEADEPRPF